MRAASVARRAVPPAELRAAAERAPHHLRPILAAAADVLIAWGCASQHAGPFRFPSGRLVVLVVGDDYALSYGPSAFHAPSLRRFLRKAGSAVVVSGAADPRAYTAAVAGAIITGRNVAVIETREAHEPAWISAVQEAHPGLPTLVSTPGRCGEKLQ